ncbi:MAG TPA: YihY/virulence factor BrkB family protein, partial [Casimicrobiaceae bacterium]|nr:YihY/virulence factor BrkB family protein [Casimicrobiaceae bacterium]
EAATGQIFEQLRGLFGNDGAAAIQGMVRSASNPGKGALATAIGAVTLLIGATTVFGELQSALDRIWRSPAAEKKEGLWNLVRTRFLSFGLILAIGFLLLVSLVVSAGISALGSLWGSWLGGLEFVLQAVNFVVSLAIVTVLFAMIYRFLPRARIGWHDVWIGAAVTALLFTIGKFLIGLYIGKSSVVSGFGAAGSLAVVLIWVYYSAQIFLLGAEFTWVYSYRYGSHKGEAMPAHAGSTPYRQKDTAPPARDKAREVSRMPEHRHAAPAPLTPAARRATTLLNRHPQLGLALAVAIGGLAAMAARFSGRLR